MPVYGGGGVGFADPMTSVGDQIIGGASGAALRNPIGVAGQMWVVPPGTNRAVASTGAGRILSVTASGLPSGNAARTLECWYKGTTNNSGRLFAYGPASGANQGLDYGPTTTGFFATDSTGNTEYDSGWTGGTPLDGNYHHAVLTWDGTTMRCYLDGTQIGATALAALNTTSTTLAVGTQSQTGFPNPFTGTVDEVAVYGTALSAGRVLAHFNAKNVNYVATVLSDSPLRYYRFEEPSTALTAVDSGSNATNATYQTNGITLAVAGAISAASSPQWMGPNTGVYTAGANPSRVVGTPVTNGLNRRTVFVSIDLNSAATGKAYAGFVTTVGGTAVTIADFVGLPAGAALAVMPRFFYSFKVDPNASYTITTDLGTGAVGTLINVVEVDD